MLSPESQLEEVLALLADCKKRRESAEDGDAAKLANVEATAHKLVQMLRQEMAKAKPKGELAGLSDDELKERKLKLVKELSK